MKSRERRWTSDIGDVCIWHPRRFGSETNVAIRKRLAYQRQASSARALVLTTDSGS